MKTLNYFGLQVPKEFGGAAMDSISAAIVMGRNFPCMRGGRFMRYCAQWRCCLSVYPVCDTGAEKTLFA